MQAIPTSQYVATYLRQTRAIIEAGGTLADALEIVGGGIKRDIEIDVAVEDLQEALKSIQAAPLSRHGFTSYRDSTEKDTQADEITIDDRLALAAADATVAHVLFAASDAVGEKGDAGGAEPLRHALRTAEMQEAGEATTSKQGFAEAAAFASSDLSHAVDTFKEQAKSALESIIHESDEALENIFASVAESKSALIKAFSQVNELFDSSIGAATLLRSAWQKLLSALQGLLSLIEETSKAKVGEELLEVVKADTIRRGLELVFASQSLGRDIDSLKDQTALRLPAVDDLSGKVKSMARRFATIVANIRRIATVVALVAPIILAHVAGPFAPLALPAAYSLEIAAILVLGYDFTHQGHLNNGDGIQEFILKVKASTVVPAGS